MYNYFIFIIWSAGIWAKDEIIKDLNKSFDIVSIISVKWSKTNLKKNLYALYGNKINGHYKEKIIHCGKGPFTLIVIKDNNPKYEIRSTTSGKEAVNTNTFDKKNMYRAWTGGGYRIHSSNSEKETIHDLTTIFGTSYMETINEYNYKTYNNDTLAACGFGDVTEFRDTIASVFSCKIFIKDKKISIIAEDGQSIRYFVGAEENNERFFIGEECYVIKIYSELEGDIPIGLTSFLLKESEKEVIRFFECVFPLCTDSRGDWLRDNSQVANEYFESHNIGMKYHTEKTLVKEKTGIKILELIIRNKMKTQLAKYKIKTRKKELTDDHS